MLTLSAFMMGYMLAASTGFLAWVGLVGYVRDVNMMGVVVAVVGVVSLIIVMSAVGTMEL